MAFNEKTRRELVDQAQTCLQEYADTTEQRDSAGPASGLKYADAIRQVSDRLRELTKSYREGLHVVQLSRCPFSAEAWLHSWDPFGLDGLWWNFHNPVRLLTEPCGGRYHAFSGAVQLDENQIPKTPFLVEPGPQRPFVLPRLMEFESVTAVVSQVQFGPHTAFPIVYYSDPQLSPEDGANEWGCNQYFYLDDRGGLQRGEYFDAEDEHFYDLKPWLESKRLKWIAPDDGQWRVQSGVQNCPYLNLEGLPKVMRIMNGRVW